MWQYVLSNLENYSKCMTIHNIKYLQSSGAGQGFLAWSELSSTTPQPVYHPPPKVATPATIATREQYAAKCSTFMERVTETLDIADIQQELTRENYKEKFHKLLCWEEKEHVEILGRRLESICGLGWMDASCTQCHVRSFVLLQAHPHSLTPIFLAIKHSM